MSDLPDDAHDLLCRRFARCEELDLNPEWHDDRHGFDYDCPTCNEDPHRCTVRWIGLVPVLLRLPGQPMPYNARGPAA